MKFEGAEPQGTLQDKAPRSRLSATPVEVAMARLGYIASDREEVVARIACGGPDAGEDFTNLTAHQAEVIVAGNIALLRSAGSKVAQTAEFAPVREAVTSGVAALRQAAEVDIITFYEDR